MLHFIHNNQSELSDKCLSAIVPAVDRHVQYMAENLRHEDKVELWYSGCWKPLEALQFSKQYSEKCFTAIDNEDGLPILMFGVSRQMMWEKKRTIWLLCTDKINKTRLRKELLRECEKWLLYLANGSKIYNNVHAENRSALRFLKAMGFKIEQAKPSGLAGAHFHYVERDYSCAILPPPPPLPALQAQDLAHTELINKAKPRQRKQTTKRKLTEITQS